MSVVNTAMLVRVSISQWNATAKEEDGARQIERDAGASAGTVSARKKLLPDFPELEALLSHNGAIRTKLYEQTVPYDDAGNRMYPASKLFEFVASLRADFDKGDELLKAVEAEYPNRYGKAQMALGKMFNEKAYPHPSELRSKFGYRLEVTPLPATDSLRNLSGISKEEADRLVADTEAAINERVRAGMRDIWSQLHKCTTAIADKLSVPAGQPGGTYRDSLVHNLSDLVERMETLNITGDKQLADMADEARAALVRPPQLFRNDDAARARAAATAKALAAKMASNF